MGNLTPRKDVALGLAIAVQQELLTYSQAEEIFTTIHKVSREKQTPEQVKTILDTANQLISEYKA